MTYTPELIVFSDLDGTLLDHDSYSWKAALPALERLRDLRAGVILASSKTAAEIAPLRDEIGLSDWPAIVENGGGLLEAGAGAGTDAAVYHRIRDLLAGLPPGFRGFGDMTVAEVARLTGLDKAGAARAKARQFSEPGLWTGAEEAFGAFAQAAERAGLTLQRGGRFTTLSFGTTKAQRMAELVARYRSAKTIALGDAPNDAEMLRAADFAVLVRNPHGPPMPQIESPAGTPAYRTERAGAAGWAEGVFALLDSPAFRGDKERHV